MKKLFLLLLMYFSLTSGTPPGKGERLSSLLPPARHDYALFFAVNDYAPGSGFGDLSKPVENAEAIAKELRERYGFTTEVVKNPTLEQIGDKLTEYNTRFTKNTEGRYPSNGQLLIYFTGHGYAENNNGYFVPADGRSGRLYSTAFAYNVWRENIDRIDCRHILVAIDACYSVTFDPDWYNKKMDLDLHRRPNELSEGDRLLLANETDKCRILWCSDGSEDKVPEQSNFARKMLDGLRNGPRQDGILTSEGLEAFLRFASPIPRLTAFGRDENGSFLFVQKAGYNTLSPTLPAQTAELEKDLLAWKTAKTANTIAAYQDYLTRFPNGEFRQQANDAIGAIQTDLALRRDDLAWEVAKEKNTAEAYKKYQADFPNGRHYAEADIKIQALTNPANSISWGSLRPDEFVRVKGGTFNMGCTSEQKDCFDDEKPVHQVTLSDFYIGKYEVTQQQWRMVMGDNPSSFKNCDDCPVESVSWDDVQEFLKKLNQSLPAGQKPYRLPTEAEWEYAAREGGKAVLFGNGKNVADPAEINFDGSSAYKKPYSIAGVYRQKTTPVGSFPANALGLYDMSGNVWEWCSDWKGAYASGPQTNPAGPTSGSGRVVRGGSWSDDPQGCRVAYRSGLTPGYRVSVFGFRLARTL